MVEPLVFLADRSFLTDPAEWLARTPIYDQDLNNFTLQDVTSKVSLINYTLQNATSKL